MSQQISLENFRDLLNSEVDTITRGSIVKVDPAALDHALRTAAATDHPTGVALKDTPSTAPCSTALGGAVLVLRQKNQNPGLAAPVIPPNTIVGPSGTATEFHRCAAIAATRYPLGVVIDGAVELIITTGPGVVPYVDIEYYALVALHPTLVPTP